MVAVLAVVRSAWVSPPLLRLRAGAAARLTLIIRISLYDTECPVNSSPLGEN